MELDETGLKILRTLVLDPRLSSRQIAKQCRLSTGTVLARIKRMENEGIIKGYTALVNQERLGYELTAVIEITVSKGKLLESENEIAKLPNVCCVYDVTGIVDTIVVAKFRDREDLSEFSKRLLTLPYVERTNTHIVLTTIKEDLRLV